MTPLRWAAILLVVACNGAGPGTAEPKSSEQATVTASGETEPETQGNLTCWVAPAQGASGPVEFVDATSETGMVDPLTGLHGHAAAFGDHDGDGVLDLVVGTFGDRPAEQYRHRGADGPRSDRLLRGGDRFAAIEEFAPELARTSGAAFADLDGDGDPDLILVRHSGDRMPAPVHTVVLENDSGSLVPATELLAVEYNGRTPVIADFDADGRLDLYISEDRYGDTGGVLFRSDGGLSYTDVTTDSGLEGVFSLGAAAADLDGDGLADLVTSDRMFLNSGDFTFRDVTPADFGWGDVGPEDDPAGVAIGDVNNDGVPDVVVGQHFRSIVEDGAEVPVRLFLGMGIEGGEPVFEEVTESAGLIPLPALAPHVELADVDNDGWLDIVTSASALDGEGPAIFRNNGSSPVSFEVPAGLGSPHYWVGAPVADYDRDGRLDVFALEWEPSLPSRLFNNTTVGGHWLEVSVAGSGQGVGTVVEVESAQGALLGRREIGVTAGYASGGPPYAHLGLGDHQVVDVRISMPGASAVTLEGVAADQHIRWPDGC